MKRVVLGTVLFVVVAVAGLVGYRQFVLLPAVRAPILAQLKDPSSAQFEDDRIFGPWRAKDSFYCGRVNAKNEYGGYQGFRFFGSFPWGHAQILDVGEDQSSVCDMTGYEYEWWWLRR